MSANDNSLMSFPQPYVKTAGAFVDDKPRTFIDSPIVSIQLALLRFFSQLNMAHPSPASKEAEVPWHSSYPLPRNTNVSSISRTELIQMFRDSQRPGKDFVLVDLRRSDHEVEFCNCFLRNQYEGQLNDDALVGRNHSRLHKSSSADFVPNNPNPVYDIFDGQGRENNLVLWYGLCPFFSVLSVRLLALLPSPRFMGLSMQSVRFILTSKRSRIVSRSRKPCSRVVSRLYRGSKRHHHEKLHAHRRYQGLEFCW